MNTKTLTEALALGGKTALKTSAAGGLGLLLYVFLIDHKVVYLPYAMAGIGVVSVLLGGIKGGMSAGTMGWLHGFVVAVFYSIVITVIRLFLYPSSGFGEDSLMLTAAILAAGSIGGVAGINVKFRFRKRKRYMVYQKN